MIDHTGGMMEQFMTRIFHAGLWLLAGVVLVSVLHFGAFVTDAYASEHGISFEQALIDLPTEMFQQIRLLPEYTPTVYSKWPG